MNTVRGNDIHDHVEKRKPEIVSWLKEFIRYPSENKPPDGYEKDAQDFLEQECRKEGLITHRFSPESVEGITGHPAWLRGRNYPEGRDNLVAVWKGEEDGRSLLLSGHTDVAPFEPDNWEVCRPYDPLEKDGRLYGRGSADMKGGMAAAFWAVKVLKELGFRPSGDIIWEALVDEEFAGGNGTLAARLKGYNTDFAVLTEPSCMELCPACLGAFLGSITLEGNAGMPFTGYDIANPISGAARVIRHFESWSEEWISRHSHPLFTGSGKELKTMLWNIDSTTPGTSLQMGTPQVTKLSWIVWCYPGAEEEPFFRDVTSFWESVRAEDGDISRFNLSVEKEYHFIRPWETGSMNQDIQVLSNIYEDVLGLKPKIAGAPFSCDMAVYGDPGGIPVVILGPSGDNLHGSDEWVSLEDVFALTEVFAGFILSFSA